MISVQTLSAAQGIAFGTSGLRGLVSALTPELCYAYTTAFIQAICSQSALSASISSPLPIKKIALGMDLRPSSPAIAKACGLAIEEAGYEVVFCGAIPTPTLAFYGLTHNMPCIMVTGSHIPFDRNGIKFYRADGEITKADETAILNEKVALSTELHECLMTYELPKINDMAANEFIKRYLSLFADFHSVLAGMKIGFYQHSSVARDLLTSILQSLGATVVALERTDHFVPIDTEAVSPEDIQKGFEWSREGFDALISTDGDGDRPLIGDEQGVWLRGDIVGILCAEYLNASHVVTPVNSNTALEESNIGTSVRTKIGSPYVIAGMESVLLKQQNKDLNLVGYEANGGFLVGTNVFFQQQVITALPTRDSFLPIILLLAMSNMQKQPISALSSHLLARFTASDRIKNVPTDKSKALLLALLTSKTEQEKLLGAIPANDGVFVAELNQLDGLRMTLTNKEIVHLRPSGNAPELRCYAEANSSERAIEIVQSVLNFIAQKV